jgi:hypothetical protein
MTADVPLPKVSGEDAPEGFNKNEVLVYKGYFCKFMCQKEWDNFSEEQIFLNQELKDNARALYNEESEKVFLEEIFDQDAEYQRLTRFVLNSLISQSLLKREEATYWKTSKLKELCPKILAFVLPGIDYLVDEYDKQHGI